MKTKSGLLTATIIGMIAAAKLLAQESETMCEHLDVPVQCTLDGVVENCTAEGMPECVSVDEADTCFTSVCGLINVTVVCPTQTFTDVVKDCCDGG
jgi:hypothetical protein